MSDVAKRGDRALLPSFLKEGGVHSRRDRVGVGWKGSEEKRINVIR